MKQSLAAHYARNRQGLSAALIAALAAGSMLLLCACDPGYFAHAGYEEARLLWNRKPITKVLEEPNLEPDIRQRLETVLAVRKFAADNLGERVGGAYETVTPVDKNAVVWVVMAAPQDSLKPYLWWFPIVGDVPYRGYFERKRALAEAESMEARGYDTFVRPAAAFSSLGFFNDPLLSNLLELNRVELAGVLIHELFHRTYFLASDAMFDESAANWVGDRGAVDFFVHTEGANSADAIAAWGIYESDLKLSAFLLQEEARLLRLYNSGLPRDEILKRRVKIFASISTDYARLKPSLSGLERFNIDKEKLNNALLLDYLLYFHDQDNFAALERMNHGDTRATIHEIIALAKGEPDDPFHAIWLAVQNQANVETGAAPVISAADSTRFARSERK